MALNEDTRQAFAQALYDALRTREPIAPLTETEPGMSIDDAYDVSLRFLRLREERDGERVIGRKIGITARAVQQMLNVNQPDFGFLTDAMLVEEGQTVPASAQMIAPRAEGEIAFVLGRDLAGPGVTVADVIAATDFVLPCFEIVDSRIRDWKIKIQDTIADNASCGYFMLGHTAAAPEELDLGTIGMTFWKNGEVVATGTGSAALGSSPLSTVAWLANTFGARGETLKAGDVILSGSLVPLVPVQPGDCVRIAVGGLGALTARFE